MNTLKEYISEFIIKEIERLIKTKDELENEIVFDYSKTKSFSIPVGFQWTKTFWSNMFIIPKECINELNKLQESFIC